MPVRVLLTGTMKGAEVGSLLSLIREGETSGVVTEKGGLVPLAERIKILREVEWASVASALAESRPAESATVMSH